MFAYKAYGEIPESVRRAQGLYDWKKLPEPTPVQCAPPGPDLTPEWNTHRLLSDAGILDECLQRAERIMLNRRLAAAREVVADLERQIGGAS
jgi:hypothetical protein